MEQPKRRLSAVWFADIVEYTALSARDEPAALELVAMLQTQAGDIVTSYEGRIVKFIGDAVLAEFGSTDSAVRAAVSLQERYTAEAEARGRSSRLRIGVHLGEVTAAVDGDLYGDGINTAARLQHEAAPGQVIISEDVWRQLRQRPEFRFSALGTVELKGISTSVGIYDVLFGSRAAITPAAGTRRPLERGSRPAMMRVAVVVAGLVLAGAAAFMWFRTPGPASGPAAPASIPPAAIAPPVAPPAGAPPPQTSRREIEQPRDQPNRPETAASARSTQGVKPGPDTAGAPAATGAPGRPIRDLIERLAAALGSERPHQAIAALGPGAAAMSGRGVQQMLQLFGEGLTVRVGRIEPRGMQGNVAAVRFILIAASRSRTETPITFDALILRDSTGLSFTELERIMPGRRGRGLDKR